MTDFLLVSQVESSSLNTDMCNFESSQKDEAKPSRMIPQKPTENLELLIIVVNIWQINILTCKVCGGSNEACGSDIANFAITICDNS